MARSAADRAEAQFKQLCCLGLGGEAVMPALLEALRVVVPAFASSFFFADEDGGYVACCDDNPLCVTVDDIYLSVFLHRRDREIPGHSFSAALHQPGINDLATATGLAPNEFEKTDFYNMILRPAGHGTSFIRMAIQVGGRSRGYIKMYRGPGEPEFSAAERRRLLALGPYFSLALQGSAEPDPELVASGKLGMIVADRDGRVRHMSAEGHRLLALAAFPRGPTGGNGGWSAALPPPVTRICRNLQSVFAGDRSASVPTYECCNIWGGFSFRAHLLDAADHTGSLFGILIEHHQPAAVRLVNGIATMPLSRRQAEACLLLAQGASHDAIATRLSISRHTAVAHSRWIYDRLDVHNRTELRARLLTA